MRKLNGRELKAFFILSIVASIGILISLRLTGILQEPTTISETLTLETIKWEFQRPSQTITLGNELDSSYTGNEISANIHVLMGTYGADDPAFNYDFVIVEVTTNLTVTNLDSFIEGVYVVIHKDNQSTISWMETKLRFENLSLIKLTQGYRQNTQAYIRLTGVNQSRSVYVSATVFWSILTPNNQTHLMEVSFELTYYNGTAYKKIVQPFQLKMIGS